MKNKISDLQLQKAFSEILLDTVKKGRKIETANTSEQIREHFQDRSPGLPTLKRRLIKERKKSNPEKYNTMLNEIDYDLSILFSALSEQNRFLLETFYNNENKRKNVLNKFRQLQDEAHRVIDISENNDLTDSIHENFSSFKNINLENTDCYIDLEDKNVTLGLINSELKTVPLQNASVRVASVTPSLNADKVELESIENLIDGYTNTFWAYRVRYLKENNPEEVTVNLEVNLGTEYEISKIALSPQTPKTMKANIYAIEDSSWQLVSDKKDIPFKNRKHWYFSPVKTDSLRIELTQNESEVDDDIVSYIFGLKNLSVGYREFKKESEILTKPLDITDISDDRQDTINKLSIKVDDKIPSPCDVSYHVKVKEDSNIVKNPDFDDKDAWSADTFYNAGGPDGESFCGASGSLEQEIDLVKGRQYSIKGYVRVTDKNSKAVIEIGDNEEIKVDTQGQWTQFEETFEASDGGKQLLKIYEENEDDNIETEASRFVLIEGNNPDKEIFSSPIEIQPLNKSSQTNIDQEIRINTTSTKQETVSSCEDELEKYEEKYGVQFYSYLLEEIPITKSVKVYEGIDMFKREYFSLVPSWMDYNIRDTANLSQWNFDRRPHRRNKVSHSYQEDISFKGTNNTHYKFTTYLYFEESQEYKTQDIDNMYLPNESLYINNKKMNTSAADNSKYNYEIKFKKGWNKIQLVFYIGDGDDTEVINNLNYFNIKDIDSQKQRAKKSPINRISLHDLETNVKYSNDDFFAVDGNNIIFNDIEKEDGSISSNKFKIEYKYQQNKVNKIKLLARLSTQNPFYTPKINEIEVMTKY